MGKIILKKDWDLSPGISLESGNFSGHFVGRKRELDLLVNEILHKNRGSILISGHRGVGKTSLVYKALSLILENNRDVMIVMMNAAQLEAESNGNIDPRNVIENLIRRLYTTVRNENCLSNEIKNEMEKLYKKAISKDFKLIENYINRRSIFEREEEEFVKNILIDMRTLFFIIGWTIGTILLISDLIPYELFSKILAMLFAFPIPYIFSLVYKMRKIRKHERESLEEAEELYELDNKISNLEFDLEEIHKKIFQSGKKLIYIIDEMDKLDEKQSEKILKYFKFLFTLSDAIFIFIGDEKLYNIGLNNKSNETGKHYRSKEYTYFTSRYFLTRPLFNDLSEFLDMIILKIEGLNEKDIEIFKRSLCFDAQNDYFDLKWKIRDRISYFENGHPVIELDEEKLADDYLQKARLHKAITVVMEEKYLFSEHSKWFENEKLLREIFEHAYKIYNSPVGENFDDPTAIDIHYELIRDFNNFIYRCGGFKIKEESLQNIGGVEVTVRKYIYNGKIPTDPPDQFNERTEYEKRYIELFEKWSDYLLSVINSFKSSKGEEPLNREQFLSNPDQGLSILTALGHNITAFFNDYKKMYNRLANGSPPYPYKREEVEKRTADISNRIIQLKESLPNIVARSIIQLYTDLHLKLQNIQQNADLFSGSANQIRQIFKNYNPIVVFKPDLKRQLLLIYNKWNEIKKVRRILKDHQYTHRIICFEENNNIEKVFSGIYIVSVRTCGDLERNLRKLYKEIKEFLEEN